MDYYSARVHLKYRREGQGDMALRTSRSHRSCCAYFCRGISLMVSLSLFLKFSPEPLAGLCTGFIITFLNTRKSVWIMRSLFCESKEQDSQMKRKLWIAWPFLLSVKMFTICRSSLMQSDLQLVFFGQKSLEELSYKNIH